ncbi:hypothetical protein LCGC14_2717830 [marine sediment metagenome]|uniref:Uncharacterized protein n=1 Tax=marine sediment metagenome TaxID=412755 RepID=A0A0F8ZAY0_9ZZZZ
MIYVNILLFLVSLIPVAGPIMTRFFPAFIKSLSLVQRMMTFLAGVDVALPVIPKAIVDRAKALR